MTLLARHAESAFWLGRQMERVESLARLLWVTEAFAADQDSDDAWSPILSVFADTQFFAERGKPLTAVNVVRFYLTDAENPNSAIYAATMAKENARTLRHLISTEAWREISVFCEELDALQRKRVSLAKLSDICLSLRDACYTHRGVMESTCYRDQVWRFHQLGTFLERADQVTRLIDMKYFQFDCDDINDVAPPDVAWWNTLLRSASGYHAFQRRHSFNADPADAARFVLCDRHLPLSVANSARDAITQLEHLEREFNAQPGADILHAAGTLRKTIDEPPPNLNGRALHQYLDRVQREIIALANALNIRYFAPVG